MLYRVTGKLVGNVPFSTRVDTPNAVAAAAQVRSQLNAAGKQDDEIVSLISAPMKAGNSGIHFGKALTDEEVKARREARAAKKAATAAAAAPAGGKKK